MNGDTAELQKRSAQDNTAAAAAVTTGQLRAAWHGMAWQRILLTYDDMATA
jgi:hypothetical protein